jgi:hypothetical protein
MNAKESNRNLSRRDTAKEATRSGSTVRPARTPGANAIVAILAAGVGLGFAYVKHSPESSSASVAPNPIVASDSFPNVTVDPMQIAQEYRNANKLAGEFALLNAATPVPLTDLKTNPFRASSAKPIVAPILVGSAMRAENR